MLLVCCLIFFKQKSAYEMRISDWSSDVCSSDLSGAAARDGIIEIGVAGDDAALLGTTRGTRGVGADQADDIETGGAQRRYMRTAAEAGADDEGRNAGHHADVPDDGGVAAAMAHCAAT